MDQHPVPRNITGFQFQLIGFMTLKQFSYLIVGCIFAFIFYKAPLAIFSLPLAAFSLFLGVAFAFLPIQERPLEIWVRNFIRSIYAPTQYIYQKETVHLPFLEEKQATGKKKPPAEKIVLETHYEAKQKMEDYLRETAVRKTSALDAYEQNFLQGLSPLFNQRIVQAPALKTSPVRQVVQPTKQPINALPRGIIAGLVKSDQNILPGILVNVKSQSGEVVRILKTDANGRFASKLPLSSGFYTVAVEDPNKKYHFKNFDFKVNGEATVPWLITNKL